MEPECSLLHSQVLATCPYPEPSQSSPHPHIPLPEDPSCPLFVAEVVPTYQSRRQVFIFRNKASFYGEEMLVLGPIPKLEDHPLSAVRDLLFNVFAATFHVGGRFSIRNLRTRHAMVTGTHSSRATLHSTINYLCFALRQV